MSELNNKNTDWVYKVRKNLASHDVTAEAIDAIIDEVTPEILEGQVRGELASKLFGTPVEFTNQKLGKAPRKSGEFTPKVYEQRTPYVLASNFFIITTFMFALACLQTFNGKDVKGYGPITVLAMAIGGAVIFRMSHVLITAVEDGKKGDVKFPRLKALGKIALLVIAWIAFIFIVLPIIPASINQTLPFIVNVVITAIAAGAWVFLAKVKNVRSSFAARVK
ncbi:MAG: DUF1129 domain-containing protein [Lactobacillales bacterium]|jgi:uncharacterized membrane-anchored protein|nr:DUF1129 domain-containing protein [Lactobacillales bacterium]